jgi:hypothetical protein
MQVSKGLKRATGRGEQVQHHFGTLNFCNSFEFPMAPSPKVPRLDAARVLLLPSLEKSARSAKLDFAGNPNHYRANQVGKAKPSAGRRFDLSPRIVLGLSLECETAQILDSDFEE